MFIRHEVADYALWKKHYDDFSNYQKTHGVINEFVYQSTDNPNSITVIHDFNNIEEAKSFAISDFDFLVCVSYSAGSNGFVKKGTSPNQDIK